MEDNLSNKIKGIIGKVATEVNDLNKEYSAEKITAADKTEQIRCCISIAQFRATHAVKASFDELLETLKAERINTATLDRIKDSIAGNF